MLLTTFEFDKKRKWAGKETAKLKIKNLNHCISFWENLKCEIQKWENINIVTFLLDFIPLMHGIPYTQSGVIQPSWLWRLLYFVNCDYEVSLNRGSRLWREWAVSRVPQLWHWYFRRVTTHYYDLPQCTIQQL